MTSRNLPRVLAVSSAIALSSCTSGRIFDRIDDNDNQKISRSEFVEHVQTKAFRTLDADSDDRVTRAEWLARETTNQPELRFGRLDSDGNGELSLTEFSNTPRKRTTLGNMFGTMDTDRDGFLTPAELRERDEISR